MLCKRIIHSAMPAAGKAGRRRTRHAWFATLFTLAVLLGLYHQPAHAQDVAIKTNSLYWLTTTTNAAVEFGTSRKTSLELMGAYNPWTFSNGKRLRFWFAQPEFRYWVCERFEGHFLGIHAHGGQYYGGFHKTVYDGYFAGGGVSYGYAWILSPHWNMEAEIGAGYAYLWYKKFPKAECIRNLRKDHYNYWGVTRLALTFSYIF